MSEETTIKIKAYHIWELCLLYQIEYKAFKSWIKPHKDKIGKQYGHKYTPLQVKIIFECLGEP